VEAVSALLDFKADANRRDRWGALPLGVVGQGMVQSKAGHHHGSSPPRNGNTSPSRVQVEELRALRDVKRLLLRHGLLIVARRNVSRCPYKCTTICQTVQARSSTSCVTNISCPKIAVMMVSIVAEAGIVLDHAVLLRMAVVCFPSSPLLTHHLLLLTSPIVTTVR